MRPLILGLFTEVTSPGGIQRMCVHTSATLASLAREYSLDYALLSLNDPALSRTIASTTSEFTLRGFGRKKARFLLSAFVRFSRTKLLFLGHPNLAPLGLLFRALRPASSYVVNAYGIDVWERRTPLVRLGLTSAQSVVTISRFTRSKLVRNQGVSETKVAIIPPALDPAFLSDAEDSGAQSNAPFRYMLTVSRLSKADSYKGVDTAIRAMAQISASFPDFRYLVAGDGDDRARLESLRTECGLSDRVVFLGRLSDGDLLRLYRDCELFILPSSNEGFGIVFLEAMAFAKPIIACNESATPEIVQHNETGLLIDPTNHNQAARAITQLLTDKPTAIRLGNAGLQRIKKTYSFDVYSENLSQLLQRFL